MDLGHLTTITQAATKLRLSRQRVHQLVRRLRLRPQKVFGTYVLTAAQMAALRDREKGRAGRPKRQKP